MRTIGWGILGPGSISRKFAADLQRAAGAKLVAVGSRDPDRAARFADEFGFRNSHGDYQSLAEDPEVDAVYIGSPHTFHAEHAILCLSHGKHVLCEKSLAINEAQAARMIETAAQKNLLLMEAMWTRFLPAIVRIRELLKEGVIGEPRMLTADFGFRAEFNSSSRLFNPELGGGTLLDLGVYPVSFASMLFGEPTAISGMANLGRTNIDEEAAIILHHRGGEMAVAATSFRVETPREAVILGTEGSIRIHCPWWAASRFTVRRGEEAKEVLEIPFQGNGYTHEAEEFMDLIRSDRRDSPIMPLDESLSVMRTMDALRRQWGVTYPGE